MAIDSEKKSISSFMHPAFGMLPVADGTLDAGDSQILVWTYADLGGEVPVSQQAVLNYESLKRIAQQGTINYEVRGLTFVSAQAILNYESLRRIPLQAVINFEALQRVRAQASLNYEVRGIVIRITDLLQMDAVFADIVIIEAEI